MEFSDRRVGIINVGTVKNRFVRHRICKTKPQQTTQFQMSPNSTFEIWTGIICWNSSARLTSHLPPRPCQSTASCWSRGIYLMLLKDVVACSTTTAGSFDFAPWIGRLSMVTIGCCTVVLPSLAKNASGCFILLMNISCGVGSNDLVTVTIGRHVNYTRS